VAGAVYLGTSGFAYGGWRGPFYPPDLRARDLLPFYASRFNSVEVNYTFRRHPAERTLDAWRAATGEGFRFALKAHQRITHVLRLAGADEAVGRFLDRARRLGDRLGVVLFQCPPSLRFDRDRIERFLDLLPPTARYAFEFRHPSWAEAASLLADRGVAWCVADTDEAPAPEGPLPAAPLAYVRLRRARYGEDELLGWARRIGAALASGADVYCYVKHEEGAAGPALAARLRELVTGPAAPAPPVGAGAPPRGGRRPPGPAPASGAAGGR
jgi:uncharacterized protein YecE (DUF72 family)